MKEFFRVNVSKYSSSHSFDVVRPASLTNPKNNAVMFIQTAFMNNADHIFTNVQNCLIFWPSEFDVPAEIERNNVVIKTNNPHTDFCRFFKENNITSIQKNTEFIIVNGAMIAKKAKIGSNVTILPGAIIFDDVTIGDNSYIGAGAKIIGEVCIGDNVIIKENAVIGADGLTTDRDADGSALTMPQFGNVIIEDNVQIGANTVIARGAIDSTVIRKGSKIDNLCFISHNVTIGRNTFIVGETIMFGSSSIGENSMISGNSTIRNGIHIGDRVLVGMGSVVTRDVPDNIVVKGNPAK